jgi:hypothetical protein
MTTRTRTASAAKPDRLGGQVPADGVDDGGLVDVGVGVDPADHLDGP